MAKTKADGVGKFAVGDVRHGAVSFAKQLDSGETLTGTPAVTEQTTSDLTITNKAVNSAAITVNKKSVGIGLAVQFTVSGQVSGAYTLTITVTTSTSQTLVREIDIEVEATS